MARKLAACTTLTSLTSLTTHSIGLMKSDALVAFFSTLCWPDLTQLALCHMRDFQRVSFACIANTTALASLTSLNLSQNSAHGDARHLAKSPHLSGLTPLHLDRAGIDDEGALALIDSTTFTSLIRSNRIQKEETLHALEGSSVHVMLES